MGCGASVDGPPDDHEDEDRTALGALRPYADDNKDDKKPGLPEQVVSASPKRDISTASVCLAL